MPGGEIIENPRGNFLIIMDLPSNIQRLVEIADLIDVQVFAGTRMEIYQPKVASAEELATRDDKSHAGLCLLRTTTGEFYRAVPSSAANQPAPGYQPQ